MRWSSEFEGQRVTVWPTNPLIQRLASYWLSLAGGEVPARKLFAPEAIADILPYVLLAEAVKEPTLRIKYRLVGTAFEAMSDLRAGQYLDEYFRGPSEAANRELFEDYLSIMATGKPRVGRYEYSGADGQTHLTEWALFPMSVDGAISQFVAVEDVRRVPTLQLAPIQFLARRTVS